MLTLTGQPMIAIHLLPKITRGKGSQTTKFGQLTEYNVRNIFPEKSYSKCDKEASPRSFCKKLKLSIFLDYQSKLL